MVVGFTCLTSGLLVLNIPRTTQKKDKYIDEFLNNLKAEIVQCEEELKPLINILGKVNLVESTFRAHTSSFPFFIFRNNRLVFWSDNRFVPKIQDVAEDRDIVYYESSGFKSLIRQWSLANSAGDIRLMAIIPLFYEPPVSNQYLKTDWNSNVIYHPQISFNPVATPGYSKFEIDNKFIFAFEHGENYTKPYIELKYLGVTLLLLGLSFLFVVLLVEVNRRIDNKKIIWGILLLLLGWIMAFAVVRIVTDNNLANEVTVFNSRFYASSWLIKNLLHLVLLSVLILSFATVIVKITSNWGFTRRLVRINKTSKLGISILSILLLYYLITFHFLVFRDIYDNSQISLDINHSIRFDTARILSLLVFTINSISIFLLFHSFLRFWLISTRYRLLPLIGTFIAGTLIYLVVENDFPVVFFIATLIGYLFLIFWSRLHTYFLQYNYRSLLYFFSSAILSCFVGAYSIYRLETSSSVNELKSYTDILMDEDIFAMHLIDDAVNNIKKDPFISNWITSPFVSKEIISRKINQRYLGRYLDKYDVNIYVFNQQGKSFSSPESSRDYGSYYNTYATGPNSTRFEDIYVVGRLSGDPFYKRYLAFIDVMRYEVVVGHIVLDLKQKRAIQQNVYPELLVDSRRGKPTGRLDVSYAVYSGRELIYNVGEFNYPSDFNARNLNRDEIFEDGIQRNGMLHVAKLTPSRTTVIISTRGHSVVEMLSNFSYLFPLLIFVYGLALFAVSTLRFLKGVEFGFATRIQIYINLAFILPLLIVSFTTLSLLSSSSRSEIQDEYIKKGNDISTVIQQRLDNFLVDPSRKEELSETLQNAALLLNTDADLYNLSGGLIVSTQPEIYDRGLISRFIKPEAYDNIIRRFASSFIDEYQVGDLSYNITFIPIKTSDTGRTIGILSLPFFEFREILERQQIEVLTNILNIFSILFITLLIFSYFASKRLVDPLKLITNKLNKMTFSGYNEPIDWNSNDELGQLVGEYNAMIKNLEESRQKLERNQREMAWREIARQVAHEIKNPLTPMKLTLQQLQRRLMGQKAITSADIEKPITSLLHQVDVLKDIATSFSAFAKMPIPDLKKFDIIELLKKSFDLHKNENGVEIEFHAENDHLFVLGDEKLMGRITTNIILNAIQSSDQKGIKVDGSVVVSGNNVLIEISDNGPGIKGEIHDKIFLPGFSTKAQGSGIGLAIAKHGIEQSGGQIWFESEEGSGTKFYIELPLVEE